jgi:hypothetical protein
MPAFAAAHNGIHGASFDAQGAANAMLGVDAGNVPFYRGAASGVNRLGWFVQ